MRSKILIACLITLSSCCLSVCKKKRACDNSNNFPYIKIKFKGFKSEELATCRVSAHKASSRELIQTYHYKDSLIDIASGAGWDLKSNYYIVKTSVSYDSIHGIAFELYKEKGACDNCKAEFEKYKNLSFHHNGNLINGDTLVINR